MAAVEVAGVTTTTSLVDLPGHQMSPLEFAARTSPRKLETRTDLPSVPRLNLHGVLEGVQRTQSHNNDAYPSPDRLEPLSKLRSLAAYAVDGTRAQSTACNSTLKLRSRVESVDQLKQDDNNQNDSNTLQQRGSVVENKTDGQSVPRHNVCLSRERELLDNLLQVDEAEEGGLFRDDDEGIRRKESETTTMRKGVAGSDVRSQRNVSSKPPTSKANAAPSRVKDAKLTLCGWETDAKKPRTSKRPNRSEKRNRNWTIPGSKSHSSYEKNTAEEPEFRFFHYTDIAKYIQQYRKMCTRAGEATEYPQSANLYPLFFDKSCLHFESRDAGYPVKYDLTPPGRYRIPTNHVVIKKDDPPAVLHQKRQAAVLERPGLPNCSSPALLHHRFAATNSPSSPNAKLETANRAEVTHAKTDRQASEKSADSSVSSSTASSSSSAALARYQVKQDDGAPPSNFLLQRQRNPDFSHCFSDLTEQPPKWRTIRTVSSAGGRSSVRNDSGSQDGDVPYQTSHKSFSASRLRQLTFEDNALRERCETRSSNRQIYVSLQEDHPTKVDAATDKNQWWRDRSIPSHSPVLSEKSIRLKTVIAAEIQRLQQRKAMTLEQRRKLDNFRRALSNTTYHTGATNPLSSCPRLSGSIRAFYARTADANALQQTRRNRDSRKVTIKTDPDGNQPIIYVTQPRLRPQAEESHSQLKTSNGKALIGGTDSALGVQSKDFHQFTKITDLLAGKSDGNPDARYLFSANAIPRKPKR